MEEAQRRAQALRVQQKGSRRCCSTLAPVIEHYEGPSEWNAIATDNNDTLNTIDAPAQTAQTAQTGQNSKKKMANGSKKGKSRLLSKLRDGYVKLMNDMAASADYTGVASFCGGGPAAGVDCSAFIARLQREEQAKKEAQMLHSLQVGRLLHAQ